MPAHIIWIQSPTPASHSTIFCWSLHHQIQITSETCEGLSTPAPLTHYHTLPHTAIHCNTLQHKCNTHATHCNTLQHTAIHCNTLQHTATRCHILQYTATRCKHCICWSLHHNIQMTAQIISSLQKMVKREMGGEEGEVGGWGGREKRDTATHCNTLQQIEEFICHRV